jgi:hypothetical protein
MRRLATTLVIALSVVLQLAPADAQAATPPLIDIRPAGTDASSFDLALSPGDHRDLTVELANRGQARQRIETFRADAYTLVNGGFGVHLVGDPQPDVPWLTYAHEVLVLEPGQVVTRDLSVDVPRDAQPGEYLAGIAVQSAEPIPGDADGVSIKQVVRHVLAVELIVPGPLVPSFRIGGSRHALVGDRSVIGVELANTGNVRLNLHGSASVRADDGSKLLDTPIALDTVFAGDTTTVELPLNQVIDRGRYTIELALQDARRGVSAASSDVLVITDALVAPRPVGEGASHRPTDLAGKGIWFAAAVAIVLGACGSAWRRHRNRCRLHTRS